MKLYMKLYEIIWNYYMKLYEVLWNYMKLYEIIWKGTLYISYIIENCNKDSVPSVERSKCTWIRDHY